MKWIYVVVKSEPKRYDVNYQKEVNGELIEIEGRLNPHHTGRAVEYGFEPGFITDEVSENYWNVIGKPLKMKFATSFIAKSINFSYFF